MAGFLPLKNSTAGDLSILIEPMSPSSMFSPVLNVFTVIPDRSICCVFCAPAFNLAKPSLVSPAGLLEAPVLTALDNSRSVKLFLIRLPSGTTTLTIGFSPP